MSRELRARMRELRVPGEEGAAARTRSRVLAAHAAVPPRPARGLPRPAVALAVAALLLVAVGVALTAPGQAVGDWLRDVVQRRPAQPAPARPAATLPAPGRLLAVRVSSLTLTGAGQPSTIGPYHDATWSPRGRFAAVTTRRDLVAVTPAGTVRWRVTPPAGRPRRPAWSPDGFRIAYLAGPQLRVVVGDGTDDRLFFGHARGVAPAFRPGRPRTVAWIDAEGRARMADVDRAVLEWRSPAPVPDGTHTLAWFPGGRRLLAAGARRATIYDLGGRPRTVRLPARTTAAAIRPAGGPPAFLERRRGASAIRLLGRRRPLIETSGRYQGLVWSPDGRWLVTRWGDRWLLVRHDGRSVATTEARGTPLDWAR